MNNEQLQQNIAKYYEKLPVGLQEFFSGMKWMETLKNISTKYSLKEEQISTLGTETTLLLLAIINTEDYVKTIDTELKTPKEVTDAIFNEISELILKDIYEELENTFLKNSKDLLDEKYGGDKKLDDRFVSLPKEVQMAINESNYQPTLYSIAEKYKLNIEQMGILEEVTTKVMLNIIHPDKYEEELLSKLTTLNREDVINLEKDVNENILKTIRESLKRNWNEDSSMQKVVNSKTEEIPKNIIEEKLNAPTISVNTVSDHSVNKIDPYREVF